MNIGVSLLLGLFLSFSAYGYESARYESLLQTIRCVVCQGQSIAESNADIAVALRTEVAKSMTMGKRDREIIDELRTRYGDSISYTPPVKPTTWPLWLGPVLILFGMTRMFLRASRGAMK